MRAQSAFADKREVDLAADAAIDTTIGIIRDDIEIGRFDHTLGVGQSCAKRDEIPYAAGDVDVVVECRVDDTTSGAFAAGHPFDHVIFTVGGHAERRDGLAVLHERAHADDVRGGRVRGPGSDRLHRDRTQRS